MGDNVKHFLSLGAGVQSSTLALMAAAGEVPGHELVDSCIFADTMHESSATYEWLDWIETQLPWPVHRVSRGDLGEDGVEVRVSKNTGHPYLRNLIPAFVDNRARAPEVKRSPCPEGCSPGVVGRLASSLSGREPCYYCGGSGVFERVVDPPEGRGVLSRKCSTDYKVFPIQQKLRDLVSLPRRREKGRVYAVSWLGISLDEVIRMKPSRVAWVENQFPLIDMRMTREDCHRWMEKNFPGRRPPRSACIWCPYHSNKSWRALRDEDAAGWKLAVEYERRLQEASRSVDRTKGTPYLHASLKPLSEAPIEDDAEGQGLLWGSECEGICGV